MGIATTAHKQQATATASTHRNATPRTIEEYARMFDRALAAKYVQEMRSRLRDVPGGRAPTGKNMRPSLPFGAPPGTDTKGRVDQAFLMPRLDLCECGCEGDPAGPSRITATLELPGMNKADVKLEVRAGWLVVEGIRRPPAHLRARIRSPVMAASRSQSPAHNSSLGLILNNDESALPIRRSASPSESGSQYGQGGRAADMACNHAQLPDSAAQQDADVDMEDVHRAHSISEIRYGHFRRSIKLPHGTDARDIEANMADGMLVVSWPRPRVITPPPVMRIHVG